MTENRFFIFDRKRVINLKYFIKIAAMRIFSVYYTLCSKKCLNENSNKMFDVCICAIFKNESMYLREWIEFHKIVGISHFYLYNNFSSDNYKVILDPYIKDGTVTLIEWPYPQTQMKAYTDCISRFRCQCKWLGFIDIDEFVVPNKTDTVYDFLQQFEKKSGAVIFYWKMFGTSGMVNRNLDQSVINDFTVSWNKYTDIGKCFYNTKFDFNPEIKENNTLHHAMWVYAGSMKIPPVNVFNKFCFWDSNPIPRKTASDVFPVQINHYFTKSFNEYEKKASKGDVYFKDNPHNLDYFYHHEMKCQSCDYHAYKYLIKLKNALANKD